MALARELPGFDDVSKAAERLAGRVRRTPLLNSWLLDRQLGFNLFVKAESLQHTGSFKFRGACNRLAQLEPAERERGVVAFSSGNHAQGVALAARLAGIPATIVMPQDAPALKIEATRRYGAAIQLYDRWFQDREAVAARIAEETGAILVKPFDEREIIAGQGTAALEAIAEAQEIGIRFDAFLAAASGGGLIAGCALACSGLSPRTEAYCVEPAGLDDHARSLAANQRIAIAPAPHSICDALMAPAPGELTFAINRRLLAGGLVVEEAEIRHAMRIAFRHFKLVLEPSGAVALAAALGGKIRGRPRAVAIVASGGNVDPALFAAIIAEEDEAPAGRSDGGPAA